MPKDSVLMSSKQGDQIGRFFANWATFKVSKWFVVDVFGFQIKLRCRYFWPFLTWQIFGLFFEKFGDFFLIFWSPWQQIIFL
jgi:hypothetical protein